MGSLRLFPATSFVSFYLLMVNFGPVLAFAQETLPERSSIVAQHLLQAKFEEIRPGLSAFRTRAPNNVELIVVNIDPTLFSFAPIAQQNEQGEDVVAFAKTSGAVIAFNGGFFKEDAAGRKNPVGLFRQDGKSNSLAWKSAGGYFVMEKDGVSILPTRGSPTPKSENLIQSKPALIEPGGRWAMNKNIPFVKKRTLICLRKTGDVLLMMIVGGGMSLYEAGWLFREKPVGGVYECDSALAMDGGGSTQIWFENREDLSFTGETKVHNAIVVNAK